MMIRSWSRTIWLYILAVLFASMLGTGALAVSAHAYMSAGSAQSANSLTRTPNLSGEAQTTSATGPNIPSTCPANYEITQTQNATPVAGTDLVAGSRCDDCP